MANLRRKIEKDTAAPVYILTEVGVGYRFTDNEAFFFKQKTAYEIAR